MQIKKKYFYMNKGGLNHLNLNIILVLCIYSTGKIQTFSTNIFSSQFSIIFSG